MVRFGNPDPTPQQHLGWCSTTITESSTVCVCKREGQRQRQTGTEEREIGLRGRDQREGKRKRGIRKKKIYYLNNTNFKNCCSKLKTARGVHKIQHLNPLKWRLIKNSLQNIVTKHFFFFGPHSFQYLNTRNYNLKTASKRAFALDKPWQSVHT